MKNKEGFFKTVTGDLRRGIMRPIYVSDDLAVLSVAESFYIASDYTVSADGYVAYLVNSKMVRAMLVDSTFLERFVTTTDQAALSQMLFRLTSTTFRSFQNTKKHRSSEELTHKFVDHELEAWIEQTYGKPCDLPDAEETPGLFASIKERFFH